MTSVRVYSALEQELQGKRVKKKGGRGEERKKRRVSKEASLPER